MQKLNQTIEQSNQATAKMNELADSMIYARNTFVGGMTLFASFFILRRFLIGPFVKTYKFLSN